MKRFLAKIDEWISTHIKLDDTLHCIAGIIVTFLLYIGALYFFDFDVDFHLVSAIGFMGCLLVAIFKEAIIDTMIKKQEQSLRDIISTMVGSLIAIAFMEAFKAMNIFVDMYVRETIMNMMLQ